MEVAPHELAEHEGGELVGLVVGGDADNGERFLPEAGDAGRRGERVGGQLLLVVGELGYELADAEEEEVAADVVEVALVAVNELFRQVNVRSNLMASSRARANLNFKI